MNVSLFSPVARVSALTVLIGIGTFLAVDLLREEERELTFDRAATTTGPVEAINGTPFPYAKGVLTITEPLAHIRVPLKRTLPGKRLVVQARVHLDEADVLEVGIKKSAFWLDYDRRPLQHRILDALATSAQSRWQVLRSGSRAVYLNPAFERPWTSVEEFEQHPPDGKIGLYGNAVLAASAALPFRVDDDPNALRAIYAWYPEPSHDPEWVTNEQTFDLTRAFQNPDASVELMFFAQRRGNQPIRVLMDFLVLRVEPGQPNPRDLLFIARQNLVKLLRRPAPLR